MPNETQGRITDKPARTSAPLHIGVDGKAARASAAAARKETTPNDA